MYPLSTPSFLVPGNSCAELHQTKSQPAWMTHFSARRNVVLDENFRFAMAYN
jgi:hypothetical protein